MKGDSYISLRQLFSYHLQRAAKAESATVRGDALMYVSDLLVEFAVTENAYRLKDESGTAIQSVFEMLAKGDVRLGADSFDEERRVNKYVGDYVLFHSGIYPDKLEMLELPTGGRLVCNYTQIARESYHVVSSFDHEPYKGEVPIFVELSRRFDLYRALLHRIKSELPFAA